MFFPYAVHWYNFHLLTSQSTADDDDQCDAVNWQEYKPFQPDGFALVLYQFRPQVQDDDAQAVDGMEQSTEEDEYLEEPVLVDGIDEDPGTCSPGLVGEKGSQHVQRNEDDYSQAANPVQDKSQHRPVPLISQAFHKANIPFETHLLLLNTMSSRDTTKGMCKGVPPPVRRVLSLLPPGKTPGR